MKPVAISTGTCNRCLLESRKEDLGQTEDLPSAGTAPYYSYGQQGYCFMFYEYVRPHLEYCV